jgi:hypothetical protein
MPNCQLLSRDKYGKIEILAVKIGHYFIGSEETLVAVDKLSY